MRGVYGRIFVTVGIASLLMLALGTAATFVRMSQRIDRISGPETAHAAAAAAAAIERGGEPALREWLRAEEAAGDGQRVLLFDANGRDILGRTVPEGVAVRAPSMLAPAADAASTALLPARWVPQVRLPDGRRYAVYLAARGPSWWTRVGSHQLPLILLGLAIVVSGAVAGILARNFSRPIRELAGATRSLAAGLAVPELGAGITGRSDELGALARDFTAMARRLEHMVRARDQLVRDMSHELRTPLARLNVALELLRRKDGGQRFEVDIARIQQQVDRLDHMIESILGLSRLDAMTHPPPFQRLELLPFVEDVVEEARLEATQRGCAIELHAMGAGAPQVYANPAILGSALQNVLRNAIRYTREGTHIDVGLRVSDGEVGIVVRDRGPGVPPDALEHIFEPFYRVDEARGGEPGGTGLGLAIVARVMHLHRGSARAGNLPSGGLEVVLTLPLLAAGETPREPDYFGSSVSRPAP